MSVYVCWGKGWPVPSSDIWCSPTLPYLTQLRATLTPSGLQLQHPPTGCSGKCHPKNEVVFRDKGFCVAPPTARLLWEVGVSGRPSTIWTLD